MADVGQEVDDHVAEDVVLVAGDHVAGVGHVDEAGLGKGSQFHRQAGLACATEKEHLGTAGWSPLVADQRDPWYGFELRRCGSWAMLRTF